ncbi:MAG: class II fumarate hydratase [Promethearchaeota archaeon Loki_b32]|nr:MAG: class II fumarate hydratase [Candidatus Lokiarchaeota archaeon Loki_b32]
MSFRTEKDVLGEIEVPSNVYWGINTQRAIKNFQISGKTFPQVFITALAQLKKACLLANMGLDLINKDNGNAVLQAINEILKENKHLDQFPIDIFQTGSGTQTNMNMNEVLANRANEILGHPRGKKYPVHPNDHVNKSQSSNDVIPSTMHISALHMIQKLFPTLEKLIEHLDNKIKDFKDIVKVGRTHLQDAVPIPLSLEFEVYKKQIKTNLERLKNAYDELYYIPIGGTALGTGLNAHKDFAKLTVSHLSKITDLPFKVNPVKAEGIASHNTIVNLSGNLRLLALSLLKMANDIRLMGSGPRAGLSELILPQNEPGSSIMPGKINPTQSEALIQVCLQVIGNDSVVSFGEAYGSILDLNVCKPIMIINLLESIEILIGGINSFIDNCLSGLKANIEQINKNLERMLMIVTNLTPIIGYDKCSEIAQRAYKEGKSCRAVIKDMGLKIDNLDELLDPKKMV